MGSILTELHGKLYNDVIKPTARVLPSISLRSFELGLSHMMMRVVVRTDLSVPVN